MMVQPPQTHNHGNMTTMGKVDTSDDSNKMCYKYILSLTMTFCIAKSTAAILVWIILENASFFPWERMSTTRAVSVLQKEVLYHSLFP